MMAPTAGQRSRADVVIIGGSVVGSSAAWHLLQEGFAGRIVVVERDPTYVRASAHRAMGGIRQQFCTPVTVQMVQYSVGLADEAV
jgi:FAD-dependent oxidoreductase domain-containing protein 1